MSKNTLINECIFCKETVVRHIVHVKVSTIFSNKRRCTRGKVQQQLLQHSPT